MARLTPGGVTPNVRCAFFDGEKWRKDSVAIPAEIALTIKVNGYEIARILCTPTRLPQLVLGYLYSEGVITGKDDVTRLQIGGDEKVADVMLKNSEYIPPHRGTLTSGCGSGVSSEAQVQRIDSDLAVKPEEVLSLMKQLYQQQNLFKEGGGMHCSALGEGENLLIVVEDIGRHNTLDKIMGECLLNGLSAKDRILLTTGRISSEMPLKAARMQAPVVVSRGTPTDRAIWLGRKLGITIIGYARDKRLSVFSERQRVTGTI